ncbi:CAP domain-containing protein [Streptomyces ochraceiscleroticus]|uniref:CAP domain-containing protein n=1 Tax=Streptomyces ochraceiscleroticus TaxID=47761 RepID=A0ABW1MDD7_9ACTN|nr:CAP domain-containing protein [Streptomyces ochraceiscleroticus]
MGRHRRTAPVPGAPAAEPATGRHRARRPAAPLRFAGPSGGGLHSGRALGLPGPFRPGGILRTAPVRTGLLGVSAALAMGAVAVSAGLLPGNGPYDPGRAAGPDGRVTTGALPDPTTTAAARSPLPADRGAGRPDAPDGAAPSSSASPPTGTSSGPTGGAPGKDTSPGGTSGAGADSPDAGTSTNDGNRPKTTRPGASSPASPRATNPAPSSPSSASARVLSLVNKERDKAGCAPLTTDPDLTRLAQRFSKDMARRDFFAHTDPDGATPWDRAKTAGVTGLGGENIARGQTTPEAVMDSWMNSPGHRANILNCTYRTLGVGLHRSPTGPWWTQDFGF